MTFRNLKMTTCIVFLALVNVNVALSDEPGHRRNSMVSNVNMDALSDSLPCQNTTQDSLQYNNNNSHRIQGTGGYLTDSQPSKPFVHSTPISGEPVRDSPLLTGISKFLLKEQVLENLVLTRVLSDLKSFSIEGDDLMFTPDKADKASLRPIAALHHGRFKRSKRHDVWPKDNKDMSHHARDDTIYLHDGRKLTKTKHRPHTTPSHGFQDMNLSTVYDEAALGKSELEHIGVYHDHNDGGNIGHYFYKNSYNNGKVGNKIRGLRYKINTFLATASKLNNENLKTQLLSINDALDAVEDLAKEKQLRDKQRQQEDLTVAVKDVRNQLTRRVGLRLQRLVGKVTDLHDSIKDKRKVEIEAIQERVNKKLEGELEKEGLYEELMRKKEYDMAVATTKFKRDRQIKDTMGKMMQARYEYEQADAEADQPSDVDKLRLHMVEVKVEQLEHEVKVIEGYSQQLQRMAGMRAQQRKGKYAVRSPERGGLGVAFLEHFART